MQADRSLATEKTPTSNLAAMDVYHQDVYRQDDASTGSDVKPVWVQPVQVMCSSRRQRIW